jgi:hypothetical protein
MKTLFFSVFLLASCSVETMNVGEGAKADVDQGEEAKPEEKPAETPPADEPADDATDPEVVVTTTTTTTVDVKDEKPAVDGTLYLVNKNAAVDKFVSENYCRGSNLHDCWIRSGKMTPAPNGENTWVVSIEFWDTESKDEPYKVVESTISVEGAMLLTDKAKLPTDEGIDYKMLWAVVDPVAKTLNVIYDWAGDGPQDQGDDLVQSFTFKAKGSAD